MRTLGRCLCAIIFMALAGMVHADAGSRLNAIRQHDRADVYYGYWFVIECDARPPLAEELERARNEWSTHTRIRSPIEIEAMLDFLRVSELEAVDRVPYRPRLVIDVHDTSGRRVTYFSDGWWLWNAKGNRARPVDEVFRSRFGFVGLSIEARE